MKTRSLIVVLGAMLPSAALAQGMPMAQGGSVAAVNTLYQQVRGWITKAAEQMPEENYSFKPTPEVRSFGQLIGHLANSQYEFCVPAKGEASPNKTDFEKVTAKADLVKGLKDAFAYCDPLYEMSDAKAGEQIDFFGSKGSRLWVLMFNVAHSNLHYGNIVTYMRLKGMVPPSSQRSGM
jgi:uncharacterized damage-inducible protein DinB